MGQEQTSEEFLMSLLTMVTRNYHTKIEHFMYKS